VWRQGPEGIGTRLSLGARLAVRGIRGYQIFLSPLLPAACRFRPTCSAYCREAIHRHGLWRGLGFTMKRLIRCHPFHSGGFDPVP
jgi:hypothetical protein